MEENNDINSTLNVEDLFLDSPPEEIETTCLKCGFTELVPDFIYDEMSEMKYHFKIKKSVATLTCQRCGSNTAIPTNYLNK